MNETWQDTFPGSNAFFDVPGSSDHSPCLVSLSTAVERRNTRFTYFSFFTTHPDFLRLLQEAGNGLFYQAGPMFTLYQKLRAAKICCKDINRRNFSGIEIRTKEALENLENIQRGVMAVPSRALFEEESLARIAWLFLARVEENFFMHKSRVA